MNAWDRFKKNNESSSLAAYGDKILAAVSGGPDSVAMLHLLWRLKKTLRFDLASVYVDHGLRKNSKKEAEFVSKLSEKLGLKCFVVNILVRDYSKRHKISIETAARKLRYEALADIAKKNGFDKIATGHNSNDNAETVIMWLLRGTGTGGLSGIPEKRQLNNKVSIIRPILSVSREEIVPYLRSQHLKYMIDESNFSLDYTRNKIRHKLIPVLKGINPGVVGHVFNLSRIIGLQNDFVASLADKFQKSSAVIKPGSIELDLRKFIGYNEFIQTYIIKNIMPEKRSALQIERILSWILSGPSEALSFSRTWRLKKNKNKLIFKRYL